jgi:hypothetical protein
MFWYLETWRTFRMIEDGFRFLVAVTAVGILLLALALWIASCVFAVADAAARHRLKVVVAVTTAAADALTRAGKAMVRASFRRRGWFC